MTSGSSSRSARRPSGMLREGEKAGGAPPVEVSRGARGEAGGKPSKCRTSPGAIHPFDFPSPARYNLSTLACVPGLHVRKNLEVVHQVKRAA